MIVLYIEFIIAFIIFIELFIFTKINMNVTNLINFVNKNEERKIN